MLEWINYAQSLTDKPVKATLTGPITILAWSFVRDDISREQVTKQIALALLDAFEQQAYPNDLGPGVYLVVIKTAKALLCLIDNSAFAYIDNTSVFYLSKENSI